MNEHVRNIQHAQPPGPAATQVADGFARRAWTVDEIDRITKGYTNPVGGAFYKGLFDNRQEALTSSIDRIDDEITRREDRLDVYEQHLIARFTALETVMAQLNAQQAYLSNSLASLQN